MLCRLKPLPVEVDTEYVVAISHSEHPENFWCHLTDNVPSLSELMDSMLSEYSNSSKKSSDDAPEPLEDKTKNASNEGEEDSRLLKECKPGFLCCVLFPVDGQYYRSIIKEVLEDGSLKVFFVDFGNFEVVNKCNALELLDNFCVMPAQAIHCRLGGISSQSWDSSSCGRFEELTDDKELLMYVVEKTKDGPFLVDLSDGETSISSCLIDGGYVLPDRSDEDQTIDVESLFSPFTWTLLTLDMEYDITITAIESPLHFYVKLGYCDEMPKVQEEIRKYVEGSPEEMSSIGENMACLVLNTKGKEYQRAKCVKVFTDEQVQVCLIHS